MKRAIWPISRTLGLLVVFSLLCASIPATSFSQEDNPAKALAHAFRQAVAKVKPAVVSISAEKKIQPRTSSPDEEGPYNPNRMFPDMPDIFKYFFPDEFFKRPPELRRAWQGSGVIISKKGEILTNVHVVDGADGTDGEVELDVTLDDGREMEAKVVATDRETDIALIQLKEEGEYPYAKIGDSDKLMVGDWVLAIGNPFGLNQSVSQGIVSAKGRTSSDVPVGGSMFTIKDYIQTTAAINPGNSGGPLINLDGEIVGVNNAIQTSGGIPANLGIGFAIPSNLAEFVVENLRQYGKVKRGYIGVMLGNLDDSRSNLSEYYKQEYGINYGALVNEVLPDTPGDKAGLEVGDLIIEYNGEKVKNSGELVNMVTNTPVGSQVTLTILRKGDKKDIEMVLAERPPVEELASAERPSITPDTSTRMMGMKVETLTPEVAKAKGYDEDQKGVIVTEVIPGGSAYQRGIQPGDVIDNINDKPVENALEFEEILKEIKSKMEKENEKERVVLLRVHRAGSNAHPRFIAPKITLE